jgi:hypothetical protein
MSSPASWERYLAHGQPVAITEFGCYTYRGAADAQTSVATDVPHRGRSTSGI